MNKKTTRIILLTLLIALLLAIIFYFLFIFKFPGSTNPKPIIQAAPAKQAVINNNSVTPAVKAPTVVAAKVAVAPASSDEIAKSSLEKVAMAFAERFGSYSNQVQPPFANMIDAKLQMTPSFQAWTDKYIAVNTQAAYSGIYHGVTTHAISDKILDFDNTKGLSDIVVTTQKTTYDATSTPAISYQDITLTFTKKNGNWLVDNAVWKK
jgi:hypothetical protein